jgi:hypothetical protein
LTGRRQRNADENHRAAGLGGSDVGANHVSSTEFTGTGINVQFAVLVAPAIGAAAGAAVRVSCARLLVAPSDSADREVIVDCRDEPEGLS